MKLVVKEREKGVREGKLNVELTTTAGSLPSLVRAAPEAILPHIEATCNLSYIHVSFLFVAATCGSSLVRLLSALSSSLLLEVSPGLTRPFSLVVSQVPSSTNLYSTSLGCIFSL